MVLKRLGTHSALEVAVQRKALPGGLSSGTSSSCGRTSSNFYDDPLLSDNNRTHLAPSIDHWVS